MLLPQIYTQLQHFKSKQQYLSVLSLQHIPSFVFNLFPASFPSQNVKARVKHRIDLSWNMSHGMTPSPETKQIRQKRNAQLTLVQVTLSWLLLPFTSTIFLPTIPLLHLCNIISGYQRKTDAITKYKPWWMELRSRPWASYHLCDPHGRPENGPITVFLSVLSDI